MFAHLIFLDFKFFTNFTNYCVLHIFEMRPSVCSATHILNLITILFVFHMGDLTNKCTVNYFVLCV